jgi:hypothetical protein
MIILFFVVVRANKDPKMALMIAIGFVLTLEYIQKGETVSAFATVGYKLGENHCVEEPETELHNPDLHQDADFAEQFSEIEGDANIAYLENEALEELPFETFSETAYSLNTESDNSSAASPLEESFVSM